jgi:hypothetical protein
MPDGKSGHRNATKMPLTIEKQLTRICCRSFLTWHVN